MVRKVDRGEWRRRRSESIIGKGWGIRASWSIGLLQEAGGYLGELASYGAMHRDIGVCVGLSPEVERTY